MWGLVISFEQKKPAQNRVAGYRDIKRLFSRGGACDHVSRTSNLIQNMSTSQNKQFHIPQSFPNRLPSGFLRSVDIYYGYVDIYSDVRKSPLNARDP